MYSRSVVVAAKISPGGRHRTSNGESTEINPSMSDSHSHRLIRLARGTLYHYRVKSRDRSGNLAMSPDRTFSTSEGPDGTPPVIINLRVERVTSRSATIKWSTDEPADSQVEYGTTSAFGSTTKLREKLSKKQKQLFEQLSKTE